MALVNLKTKYTSLKFGNDQKGGGDSGQPFVKFDMGNRSNRSSGGNAQTPSGLITTTGTVLSDFPKRGGTYPSNQIDYERIKAFLNTNGGKMFVDKQKTLQFMNPKTETGPSFVDSNQVGTLPGLVENTRVYSKDNLLGQVRVEGTGGHLSRVGFPSFGVQDEFYATTVGMQNLTNSAVNNRLLLLSRLKIASGRTGNTFSSFQNALSVVEDAALAKKLGIAINDQLMFNYPGGPNSSYGVGSTVIGRYTNTTLNTLPHVMNYAQIMQQKAIKDGAITANSIKDFRGSTTSYSGSSITWDYTKDSMERRINLANPGVTIDGLPQGKPTSYKLRVDGYSDKINSLVPLIRSSEQNKENVFDSRQESLFTKDSIKFGFECMSNDKPGDSILLVFRALLTNGFTDNHSAVLNSFRYFGRGDEFHTYQGFTRSVAFSFKIAVFSRTEMYALYSKLNHLISQVYPDYETLKGSNVMRAPLVKVTVGDYLYRTPGFLESVNVTADNNTPWEIDMEGNSEIQWPVLDEGYSNFESLKSVKVQQLPHFVEVSISFKPILNVLPRRQADGTGPVELISHNNYLWYPPKATPNQQSATPTPAPTPQKPPQAEQVPGSDIASGV
jgi:hypothetical protein